MTLYLGAIILALVFPLTVSAQSGSEEFVLGLTRNFGYGGLNKIQGNFTLKIISPPEDLDRVEFYFDEVLIAVVENEPFHYKFHTSDFSEGLHRMSAVGYLPDGQSLESNRISKDFLSSDQAWGETQQLIGPLLIGVAVLTLLGIGLPLLFNREKNFALGTYGPAGGVVCPRCQLPFSRLMMSPNIVTGKLVRCPHCGKLSVLARASQDKLMAAEARFSNKDQPSAISTGEGDLKKQIDDSRFEE